MLQLILSILAIVLAILAIIPYALEIWFRCRGKPKLLATVHSVEVKQSNSTSNADLRFWLNIKLKKNHPIFFRNLQLLLPFGAKPYQHPNSSVTFQLSRLSNIFTEGLEPRLALVLDALDNSYWDKLSIKLDLERRQVLDYCYLIALDTPTKNHNVDFALFAEMEIDEARLGFWSVFYHARRYRKLLNMKVDLNQSTNQEFIG